MSKNITVEDSNGVELVSHKGYALLVLLTIEGGDNGQDVKTISKRIIDSMESSLPLDKKYKTANKKPRCIIHPFSHLSPYASTNNEHVDKICGELADALSGYADVKRIPVYESEKIFFSAGFFDSESTTKHSSTRNSLLRHFKSLLNVYSVNYITEILYEANET